MFIADLTDALIICRDNDSFSFYRFPALQKCSHNHWEARNLN
jgi:hypothetical protein